MNRISVGAIAWVALGLGLGTSRPESAVAAAPALPECRAAWSGLVRQNRHKYSWETDARFTPNGNEGYATYAQRVQRARCVKDWTVLVYMAADNNLMPYAMWDLYEMEAAFAGGDAIGGSTIGNDVIVQLDGAGARGLRRLHMFQSREPWATRSTAFFQARNETHVKSPVVQALPENHLGSDAARFRDFLVWAAQAYPSKNYMVVIWGHGEGWISRKPIRPATSPFLAPTDVNFGLPTALTPGRGRPFPRRGRAGDGPTRGGIGFDDTDGAGLSVPAIRIGLGALQTRTGKPVDVYASDACYMQMAEVATELAGVARFVIGSTEKQNFMGFPYRTFLRELNSGGFDRERRSVATRGGIAASDEPWLLARMLPRLMMKSFAVHQGTRFTGLSARADPLGHETLTSSSLSTDELIRTVLPASQRLGWALDAYLREKTERKLALQFVIQQTPAFEGGAQDYLSFLGILEMQLKDEAQTGGGALSPGMQQLRAALAETQAAIQRTMVSAHISPRYSVDSISLALGRPPGGLSIWLPAVPEEYAERRADFERSKFYQYRAPGKPLAYWPVWLKTLFTE